MRCVNGLSDNWQWIPNYHMCSKLATSHLSDSKLTPHTNGVEKYAAEWVIQLAIGLESIIPEATQSALKTAHKLRTSELNNTRLVVYKI